MGLLEVERCCCCFSLRAGGLMIGTLSMFACLIGLYVVLIEGLSAANIGGELVFVFVSLVLCAVVNYILIVAILKEKSTCFLVFAIFYTIYSVLHTLGYIFYVCYFISSSVQLEEESLILGLIRIVLGGLWMAFSWHLSGVLYSLYRSIDEKNHSQMLIVYCVERQDRGNGHGGFERQGAGHGFGYGQVDIQRGQATNVNTGV